MTIFVVGFPQSGNTWLAKFVCQILNVKLVNDDLNSLETNERIGDRIDWKRLHFRNQKMSFVLLSKYATI